MKPELSILIPVYNEEDNIQILLSEIEQALDPMGRPYEVIMVDDGSTDRSRALLEELAARKPYLRVILFRRNAGQTAAFDAGFRFAQGQVIVTMDSDLQNDPKDIPKMLALLDQGHDFVAGWRKNRKDGFVLRKFPSWIANGLIRRVTRTHIRDLGCSLKLYRKELTDELHLYGEMHRFIGVLLEGMGARIAQFEVNHRARVAGESKYGLTRTFKVLVDLITVWFWQRYRTKPGYVFGGFGVSLIAGATLLSAYVLWEKFAQGVWVHRNPLFMIAIFCGVLGIQFVGMGLLAELVIRTYFASSEEPPYSIAKRIGFDRT